MKTIIVVDSQVSEEDANCIEYPHQYIFVNRGVARMKIVYLGPGVNFKIYELPSGREVNQETIEWPHIYHLFYGYMSEREARKEYGKVLRGLQEGKPLFWD
jgi:hypothetical protein